MNSIIIDKHVSQHYASSMKSIHIQDGDPNELITVHVPGAPAWSREELYGDNAR